MASPPYVPYQAYKSKRHTRNGSNPLTAAQPASVQQHRPQSIAVPNGYTRSASLIRRENDSQPSEKLWFGSPIEQSFSVRPASSAAATAPPRHERNLSVPTMWSAASSGHTSPSDLPSTPTSPQLSEPSGVSLSPPTTARSLSDGSATPTSSTGTTVTSTSPTATPVAGSSTLLPSPSTSDRPLPHLRKSSTFRHVPPRSIAAARSPMPSSPLRPIGDHSRAPSIASTAWRQLEQPQISRASSLATSAAGSPSSERALPPTPALEVSSQSQALSSHIPTISDAELQTNIVVPSPHRAPLAHSPPRTASLATPSGPSSGQPSPLPASTPADPQSLSPATPVSRSRNNARQAALYRPGFQPKGVYRPRTDEFLEARNHARDVGRIERTRLERRLEKLINLHFPSEEQKQKEEMSRLTLRPSKTNRRVSSIWDLDLRSKSAGELFKDMIQSQAPMGTKGDVREQEKTITPWEDDASVSQCPLCNAGFHPLTNRKHHCRLCGRIICSLPVKYPQRPQICSLLFVADPKTGKIEEVGEGVDYGVRRRPSGPDNGRRKDVGMSEEEKFLKGVRICRDCRPVLLHQQLKQEAMEVPLFSRLYAAFINLEKEIEDSLPAFQELMLSLSKHERPTPEAMTARKRLLDAFAQYDALAKRIRQLPCPGGSSQDRIQQAVLSRATIFLQKNMFPLQALPKPEEVTKSKSPATEEGEQVIDPDSEVMHVLQPLLEQEALLETFVEEAKAHRKFEDAKTLKANLREIRAEIERALGSAEAPRL